MSFKADRPPFVVAFVADLQGCGFHRIMLPLASLHDANLINRQVDSNMWPAELGKAAKPDVVIWQRQTETDQLEHMREWRKALPDALFVYELDDYIGDIPVSSFHASFMPVDVEKRIGEGMAICNRVSTTTEPMANWLRSLGATDVRVIPNGLPQVRLKDRATRISGKLRVGFAGGMSHAGDLELIRPAMEEIGEAVTWVFMGMQPDSPPCRTEFHDGVPVFAYLDRMAQLDCDLMLAPLEDHPFNQCKSNLRLVETGAICAAVIAQDTPPYHLDEPPVFAYAKTPDEWTAAIKKFMAARPIERKRSASGLMSWVGRKYTLERLLQRRADAWLPDGARWKPLAVRPSGGKTILVTADPDDICARMPFLLTRTTDTLADACRLALEQESDVLWMRPATVLSEQGWKTLRQALTAATGVASIVPLASDGPNGFPQKDQWTLMPIDTAATLDHLCREKFKARQLQVNAPSGPVVLLSRQALGMIGFPDVEGADGNEEQAILEWGCLAAKREWKNLQVLDAYAMSAASPMQPASTTPLRLQTRDFTDVIQKVLDPFEADDRESLELSMVRDIWGGPRPGIAGFTSDYEAWSALRDVQLARRIPSKNWPAFVVFHPYGVTETQHRWVVFVDDELKFKEFAHWFFNEAVKHADPLVDVIYADHENMASTGVRSPEFKPEFDYELFLAQDYVTPMCAIRVAALSKTPNDRIELFREVLRIAKTKGAKGFMRLPHILGSLPFDPAPEHQALDVLARQIIIQEELGDTVTIAAHKYVMGCLAVTRVAVEKPMVSIVVPTLGRSRLIQPCIATILQHTSYPNYEIVIVQNGERKEPELLERTRKDSHVRTVYYDGTSEGGFNWSKMNNWAIRNHTIGELIVTLNDDCCCATKGWLDNMVGQIAQPDVGAVGARLLHPSGMIQHVGVICHNGLAGHLHKNLPNGYGGYLGKAFLTHEARAVTGACMLFRRNDFMRINGFDEHLVQNYGDTKFCLDLNKLGYRNVVEMSAELIHPEATTRESTGTPTGFKRLFEEGKIIAKACGDQDPNWSPNLAIGIVQGGLGFQGLNGESLAWEDFAPDVDKDHVLLVNDKPGIHGAVCGLLANHSVPFNADLSGFQLKITAPHTLNVQSWDIRKPEQISKGLRQLGINRIVLCSLVGAEGAAPPVESLLSFAAVSRSIQVSVHPYEKATLAPFDDVEALIQAKSVFGFVDINAWEAAYTQLTTSSRREAAE